MDLENLLTDIEAILRSEASREKRFAEIAERIRRSAAYRWVGLYDVTPSEVRLIVCTGNESPAFPVFPVERGLTGEAIRTRRPVVAGDVRADSRYLTAFGTTRSEMIVPIFDANSHVIGTIDIESECVNAFEEADAQALQRVAGLLARRF